MGAFIPRSGPHRIHTLHRAGAGAAGGFLLLFGTVGAARATAFVGPSGPVVMGLFTNGLLAVGSLATGAVLTVAALRGAPSASTASVGVGCLFLLSGMVHAVLLDTAANMLAFRMTNVIVSMVLGIALLTIGSYGRFTGALPPDGPYARAVPPTAPLRPRTPRDAVLDRDMAEAERAVARHAATPEQAERVSAAAGNRSHEQRRAAFTAAVHP